MPDNSTVPVHRVAPAGFETAAAQPARAAPTDRAPTKPEAKADSAAGRPRPAPGSARDVRLRFKIDPKTNEVTVLLVDVASRRVVRTIPPDELRTLVEKELVDLFA
ncbi:MAG: flagellar protein FlaG [Chloroflexi bacterium]|nr:flagellar protein FlaG [Chloroflexota bacterium]